jgi:hypothetical protein
MFKFSPLMLHSGTPLGNRVFAGGMKGLEMTSCTPLGKAAILNYGQVTFPTGVTWDLSVGPHLEIGSFQMGLMKGLEMKPSWTSCVTHSIGPGRHIGIRSSSIELRAMVTFPKVCHLGLENRTSFGNRVFPNVRILSC